MSYWAVAQLEGNRTRLALHCLKEVAGYQVYNPQMHETHRTRGGRKVTGVAQLFPSYCFLLIITGWYAARWSPGVIRLVMDGERPAVVSDAVIAEIRKREGPDGFVRLPKPRGFVPGMRVRVTSGPLSAKIGTLAVLRPHERALVLLNLLGGEQRVELVRSAIEAI